MNRQKLPDPRRVAATAYKASYKRSIIYLHEIKTALEYEKEQVTMRGAKEEINWAHVGSLHDIESRLKYVADQLLKRGEFAPTNISPEEYLSWWKR